MALLYHYFERDGGPFRSLSQLPIAEGEEVLTAIRDHKQVFAAQRSLDYLRRRHEVESIVREHFIAKGGRPELASPYYMVWEKCPWLETWYVEPAHIAIPLEEFDLATVSFTYGDSFPTFSPRVKDGKEYRNSVYTVDEIVDIIGRYGLPQVWNPDGALGPERYIEAHVWSNSPIDRYLALWRRSAPQASM